MISVLQEWVMKLPLREQGVLLTGIRGCDLVPKLPLDSTPRQLTAFIRYCVMVPHDARETDIPGAFFQSKLPKSWKASELGHLPLHWYSHIMHCYQVIGIRHPDAHIHAIAYKVYEKLVESLHLNTETDVDMVERLSEDRITKDNVVS